MTDAGAPSPDASLVPEASAPPAGDAATNADLLAYDDMGSVAGDVSTFGTPDAYNDYALAPGFGWCAGCGWSLYGETPQAGQASVASDDLVTWQNLRTSGYRMLHQRDVQGRQLDVAGAFSAYAVMTDGVPLIGQSGTTLWMSLLVRVEGTLGSDPIYVTTHSDPSAWHAGEAIWSAGLFTTPDWSLFAGCSGSGCSGDPRSAGTARTSTNKLYAAGQATFLVFEFVFADAGDSIGLYVDPSPGAAPPAAADATITTSSPLTFRDFAFSADGPPVSFDEIRFGATFASVTPTQ